LRLNGWQRIGIVASIGWAIGVYVVYLVIGPEDWSKYGTFTPNEVTGFKWDKNRNAFTTKFSPQRFTVKVVSETERFITQTTGDAVGFTDHYECRPSAPSSAPDLIACHDAEGFSPWLFRLNTYTRAFLYGSSLYRSPGAGGDPNIWIAHGTCTKF
jgi:hypothetical protein